MVEWKRSKCDFVAFLDAADHLHALFHINEQVFVGQHRPL